MSNEYKVDGIMMHGQPLAQRIAAERDALRARVQELEAQRVDGLMREASMLDRAERAEAQRDLALAALRDVAEASGPCWCTPGRVGLATDVDGHADYCVAARAALEAARDA